MRKIPLKNYIIAAVIIAVTVILSFYLRAMYKVNNNFDSEISFSNLENYLYENPNVILHFRNGSYLKFEENFDKAVYETNTQVISIDSTLLSEEDKNNFYTKYCNSSINYDRLFEIPNIVLINNGKVTSIYSEKYSDTDGESISLFLKNNGWLND